MKRWLYLVHRWAGIALCVVMALWFRYLVQAGLTTAVLWPSRGRQLYARICSVCHGDRGDGRSRATGALSTLPRDFTSAQSRAELSRERIAAVIAHGKAGTAMVGWKTQLSEADIAVLAEHVLTQFVQGDPAAAHLGRALAEKDAVLLLAPPLWRLWHARRRADRAAPAA